MSTSLREQLKRLAVPQTASLVDHKRKASILFDPKEAATKDRRTIYELGISGLQELITLNSDFKQFELTLFDEATLDLERAVEQSEVNVLLNRNIKKFLQHLSPYFLLRPSHLCIEWLLRRFDIHAYNRNDLLALALPYHETNIFVRVLQCMRLKTADNEWEWLRPLQKPGVPLPKSAIINRAASHAGFLAFVCRSTVEILHEFETRAHLLQTHLNFYTTVVIGAFENTTDFKEWHISTLLESLLYTLSAKVVDVAASGYMIAGQLVSRTQLKSKLCRALVDRAIGVPFEELRPAAVMLIILIFDVQQSAPKRFPQKALNIILGQKWLIPVMAALVKQNIEVYPIYVPLLRDCVQAVQSKHEDVETFKRLALQLLNEVDLQKGAANRIIRCFLNSYVHEAAPKAPENEEIIDLESDEDEEMPTQNFFTAWYSDYLRRLEQKYPESFDLTLKEALSSKQDENDNRKMALKIALGYRLKMSNSSATDIYESLYHHNASIRHLAMKKLLSNLSNYQTRFQNMELLKVCLADRLNDDSRLVLEELLKLPPKDFVDILGHGRYATGLLSILHKIEANGESWSKLTPLVVRHLTCAQLLANYDANIVLLELMPLLFPTVENPCYGAAIGEILKSGLMKKFTFLKRLEKLSGPTSSAARKQFFSIFAKGTQPGEGIPTPQELFESMQRQGDNHVKRASQLSNYLVLLTISFRNKLTAEKSLQIFKHVASYAQKFPLKQMETLQKANWEEVISLQLYADFLLALARHTKFEENKQDLKSFLSIFQVLCSNTFQAKKPEEIKIWSYALSQTLEAVFPETQMKIDFLTNFYIESDLFDDFNGPTLRLMAFKTLNAVLNGKQQDYNLNLLHILKICSILTSPFESMRVVGLETLTVINENGATLHANLGYLLQSILEYKLELAADKDQYPLRLYLTLKSSKKRADQAKAHTILADILKLLATTNDINLKAQVLATLTYFNDEETCAALLPIALDALQHVVPEASGAPATLPTPYNQIFEAVIQRFQAQTIERVVIDYAEAWQLIERIFALHTAYMAVAQRGELQPLPCVLLDTLDTGCFENLPSKYRLSFIKLLLRTEAVAQNDSITLAAHKLLKNCKIECKPLIPLLQQMHSSELESPAANKKKSNKRASAIAASTVTKSAAQTYTLAWKQGVALLELLEHKEELQDAEQLIPGLFELLNFCLELEEQAAVEYTKQLTLSTLLQCCSHAKTNNIDLQRAFPKATFRIDQIVRCVRATQNPQTHQNALTLLAHIAAFFPQQVLQNIVAIFTFMGSSVVRHDDAFSFHIIDNIIDSIIPILVQAEQTNNSAQHSVVSVLKVFSDIMLDVPEHRRLSLYTKLLHTLGIETHYWQFLCIVFEAELMDVEKERKARVVTKSQDTKSKRIEFLLALSSTFEPQVVLQSCTQLLSYVKNTLPLSKDFEPSSDAGKSSKSKRKSATSDSEAMLFDVEHYTNQQLRHYKYIIMQYLSTVSQAPEFLRKIAMLSDADVGEMKPYFQNFIIAILSYVATVNSAIEHFKDNLHMKFWKVILHHLYDVLDNAISLLSQEMFLVVVIGLLQHQLLSVRKKVIDLLIAKLQQQQDDVTFIATCNEAQFRGLIKPLEDIIVGILSEPVSQQHMEVDSPVPFGTPSNNEIVVLQQTALIAVKLLSKHFALLHVAEFKSFLAALTKIIKSRSNISKIVLATVFLALIEIASNLKAHSLEYLPKFMPQIVELLQYQAESLRTQPPDHVCIAIIAGTQKLFESLPRFLGPYIVEIITALSSMSTRLSRHQTSKDQRTSLAINKIEAIWTKIAAEVYVRILVPSCEKSYENLIANEFYEEIKALMKLLQESIVRANNEDLAPVQTELRTFFLNALEFRLALKTRNTLDVESISEIENTVIEAFVAYVLKLSESAFRPLYENVYTWAMKRLPVPETQLTFFKLNTRIGEALKSLFVLFAGNFLEDAANLLETCHASKATIEIESELLHIELLKAILSSLQIVFLHASKKFISLPRFELLMSKIVDQLENRLVLENEALQSVLIASIAQLAVVVSSDVMWKQLNYQVLLKTRTSVPEVRILSFNCCVEIARKLGEEFTSLLPETVPFIAELFEDENSRVEKNTRKAVQELESILGESLQKYL